ncbi:MAG TPA: extracellular solute-binding protein, partial [Isosphaeraceae bacterium]|nr:extracellular solute-binding protein [Isosphaeraceae bacterium]
MRLMTVMSWLVAIGAVGLCGCGSGQVTPKAPAQPFQGVKLTIGAVGDQAILQTVAAQRGEWQVTHGADATIAEVSVDPKATKGVDVVVFPGDRLGDLVDAAALVTLPESLVRLAPKKVADLAPESTASEPLPNPLQFNDVVTAYRDQVTRYGMNDRLALPYGGSALVVVYRREALEGESNLSAAKEVGIKLEPPQTWTQLDALAKFLHGRDWDGDGEPESGVAIVLAADPEGLGEAIFLARAAALGQHPFHYSFLFDADTMEPRIATPPFVEALRALTSLKAFSPSGVRGFDAETAREAFRSGKVGLLIDRAEEAARWTDPKQPLKVGVAALPGSDRVYEPTRKAWEPASPPNRPSYLPRGGGWLVGVAAASSGRQREAALDFIRYLTSPDTSRRILADRAFPMLPVRTSQLGQGLPDPRSAPGVVGRQWSRAVTETLTAPRVVPGLRIPEAEAYLADLGRARAKVLEGAPVESALEDVARAWAERTQRLGKDRQLWHYRRSLNTLATA